MFQLELTFRELQIKKYIIHDGDILLIGRGPQNGIVVNDPSVSRLNTGIAREGEMLRIWDTESKNGTVVNGERVESAYLKDGDIINIGRKLEIKVSINASKNRGSIKGLELIGKEAEEFMKHPG